MHSLKSSLFPWVAAGLVAAFLLASSSGMAQQSASLVAVSPVAVNAAKTGAVPSVVSYAGALKDASGKAVTSVVGVTFLIYKDSQGGAPLWMETQSVTPDKQGRYSVQLGATSSAGLPSEVFMSGEARWLGVQLAGEAEQTRVLIAAVPYAMKAGDAATIGGLPPSAFVLAAPVTAGGTNENSSAAAQASTSNPGAPPATSNVTTTGGTVNAIPLFTTATNIQNSILTQTAATAVNVVGKLNLPAMGTATTAAGKTSRPEALVASVFNSGTSTAVAQTFQLQAEPAGNNTATASGTLNVLYASGTATPAETGLKFGHTGLITFATGQTFPGTGTITGVTTAAGSGLAGGGTTGTLGLKLLSTCAANQVLKWSGTAWACAADANSGGTITKVTAGTDLTGGGATGAVTLNLDTTKVPQLATANTFTANQTINGALTASSATINGLVTVPVATSTAVDASSSSLSATTIVGFASSTTGDAWGVEGYTNSGASNGYGVIGVARSSTGNPIGTYGVAFSPSGVGVFGQNGSESAVGQSVITDLSLAGVGTWGDGGTSASTGGTMANVGVLGTVDDGVAGVFVNDSPSGDVTLFAVSDNSAGFPFEALGSSGGFCIIENGGTLSCTGTKNAMVPVDAGKRAVAMSAIESPVNWFEDAGSGHLVNGVALVQLDPTFIQTVNTGMDYKVFPVANGDCNGLYVVNKTATSFEVRELHSGTSSVAFDYRIMALRKNYENVRFDDRTHLMEHARQMRERIHPASGHSVSHDPAKKLGLMPAKSTKLSVPRLEQAR